MAELARADDRRDPELALADQRLRVDREPRLALRRQHVVAVQVLVQQHLLALRARQLDQRLERRVEQPALERTAEPLPGLGQRVGSTTPPRRRASRTARRPASRAAAAARRTRPARPLRQPRRAAFPARSAPAAARAPRARSRAAGSRRRRPRPRAPPPRARSRGAAAGSSARPARRRRSSPARRAPRRSRRRTAGRGSAPGARSDARRPAVRVGLAVLQRRQLLAHRAQ